MADSSAAESNPGEPDAAELTAEPDAANPSADEQRTIRPEDLSADYENADVREAILAFQSAPDHDRLATFLNSLRSGLLIADVTGVQKKKKGTRARTIRSTKGQIVLPLFTSMNELRLAHPAGRRDQAKGAMMPAVEALKLIRSGPIVAVEFDAGSAALVVLRKFIDIAIEPGEITSAGLEAMR